MKKVLFVLFSFIIIAFLLIFLFIEDEETFTSDSDGLIQDDHNDFNNNNDDGKNEKNPVISSNVIEMEGCSSDEIYLDDKNFIYHSYTCDSSDQYIELGDQLLFLLTNGGSSYILDDLELIEYELAYEFPSEEEILVYYDVIENALENRSEMSVSDPFRNYQDDMDRHVKDWSLFIQLIPKEYRSDIVEYIIFAHDSTLGYVEQYTYDDDVTSNWGFAMNTLEIESDIERISTLIHEFAHLLTLGETQVLPYVAEEDCERIMLDEGCSKPDSYIQHFYDQFWVGIADQVESYDDDPDQLYDFYLDHENDFVNDYAATSLEEDIAETFSYFVLQSKPTKNLVQDEKILFFYEYPELVQLRVELLTRLTSILENKH